MPVDAFDSIVPPNDLDMERAVLGAMVLDNSVIDDVTEAVSERDFYDPRHRKMFGAILKLWTNDRPVDILTVGRMLKKVEPNFLGDILDGTPHAANAVHHAREVRDFSKRRSVIQAGTKLVQDARDLALPVDTVLAEAERHLLEVSQTSTKYNWTEATPEMKLALQEFQASRETRGVPGMLKTNIRKLDEAIGGFLPSTTNVIGGATGVGKSTLALNIVLKAALQGIPCAVFSIEMMAAKMRRKMAAMLLRIDGQRAREGRLRDWEQGIVNVAKMPDIPLWLCYDPGLTVLSMRKYARRLHRKHKIQVWCVDYLQKMQSHIQNYTKRNELVAEFSSEFDRLMKELDGIGLSVCQLKRVEKNRRPQKSDLGESSLIEKDADTITIISKYEPQNKDEEVRYKLFVVKNRDGVEPTIPVHFDKEKGWFSDIAGEEPSQYDGVPEFVPDEDPGTELPF